MSTVKTAISINETTFNEVETLAKRLKMSRSELFAKAVTEYLEKHKNLNYLEKLNEVYSEPDSEEERKFHHAILKKTAKVIDSW